MKTTTATRTSVYQRPLFLRVARKWYSWAGLALTMTASYLAFDGQLKVGGSNQLQAAPPHEADITWKANPNVPDGAVDPAKPIPAPMAPPRPNVRPNVAQVLRDYASGQPVVQANYEEIQPTDGPKIPVPQLPPDTPKADALDPIEVVVPEDVKPEPKKVNPVRPTQLPPRKLDMGTEPVARKMEEKAPAVKVGDEKVAVQEPETIPVKPTPEGANVALAREVESLKNDELALYQAAQNDVQMKDFPKAIERFERLFKLRPDLVYIRAEYAGILVTAGEMQRSIEQYKRVIEAQPSSQALRIRLGDVYVIGKDYKSAIKVFTEALKNPPYEPEYAVRLARAYVFDNDTTRATQVFDRYLAQIKPEDPKAPIAMGALLLDLDRPAEAMPYLLFKRKQLENAKGRDHVMLEVMASLVRGHARLGERQAALEIIVEMGTKSPEQIAVRQVLGDTLHQIEEYELAGQVFNQILQLDPVNGPALIGMARVHLDMQLPANARKILDSFRPAPAQVRDYLMAYSVYHQRIGEYVEAKQIYADMLRRNENDHEVRYSLGLLHDFIKEWEKGKAEFAKIPPYGKIGRDARRAFAQSLANQRKFKEALEVDRILLNEDPLDYLTVAQTINNYSKARLFDQAIALGRGFLATNPKSENHANAVRMALARALLEGNRFVDANREYEIILSRPTGRTVAAYYGLARSSEKLGNPERSRQLGACTVGLPGGDFRNRLILADLYSADYDDYKVMEITRSLLNVDGSHLPSLIRLCDAQQRQSRFPGNPADVFVTAQQILTLSPTNVRGHLAMARSFAVAQNYRKSAGQYDQLIVLDPDFFVPKQERARVLYADHQYSAARSQYQAIQKPTPDDQMFANLTMAVERDPKTRALLGPYAQSAAGSLRKELGRIALSVGDLDQKLAVQRLIADYDARAAESTAAHLEEDEKEWKDYRPWRALIAQEASFGYEPTNTESMFDYGQQLGARNRTSKAIDAYSQVLQLDPTHRDSMVASERASANMSPKFDASFDYFHQQGRQGLADIDRTRYTAAGSIPLGDENEFLQIGYTRALYASRFNYPQTLGNIPYFRVQKRFLDDRLLGYAQVNVEDFNNGFRTRPTFDIGAVYECADWIWTHGGGYLENVAENGESIRQDIHRGGIYLGADFKPTRVWGFGGEYRYAHYSDNNDANFFNLYNELSLTLPPKQLKLVQKLYFMGYRESTQFPTNPPQEANIFGAVHPYFAPDAFTQIEARIEWWHWLSRDYFVHSNQCYYSLQYGIMTDNNLNTYHNLKALVNYDICTWMTIGAQASAQLSSVYTNYGAIGYLQIRFK